MGVAPAHNGDALQLLEIPKKAMKVPIYSTGVGGDPAELGVAIAPNVFVKV